MRPIIYQIFTRLFGNTNTTNKEWGTVEENGVGKFNDITEKALKEIKKMGITHIWYTGVIEHALLTDYTEYGVALDDADVVKGRAGSPYAIKDYYDVNPDLASFVPDRMEEFRKLVTRTHKHGMKVIIDFVPNHLARGYQSDNKPEGVPDFGENDDETKAFAPNNNFYYLPKHGFVVPEEYAELTKINFPNKDGFYKEFPAKATGNDVFSAKPSINDWFETIKLNYGVDYVHGHKSYFDPIPDTWLKMRDILLFWAKKGVDGFRCDMAEMVPVAFWKWITAEIKSAHPDIIFLGETYKPEEYRHYIHDGGFDYLYDKVELYDTLKYIVQGHANTDSITSVWQSQEDISTHMLRFLENHDEQRIASRFFAGDMRKGIPMMAATSFMHTGPVLMYFGQEVGEAAYGASGFSGDDGRTTIFDYYSVPEFVKWVNNGAFDGGMLSTDQKWLRQKYIDILTACNDLPAIKEGAFYDLHYYNRNEDYEGYSDRVYVFIRHCEEQKLLILINFSDYLQTANIKIPEVAWGQYGLNTDKIEVIGEEHFVIDKSSTFDHKGTDSQLSFNLRACNYNIYELREA
ncbi:alpha-amylase family glycosyl hydrolase [Marinoscillum sp. MHG1-6]|uniref:alpha-amylase family glycosyl hydrolase n=1 Tax=Marinoscillum sp. MHG1-6 TaxID=2959627 RepID=UPI0021577B93|nr:alpha-amylase family glycosyl hydrolase [Marinoscillum sp. MHG1-6]